MRNIHTIGLGLLFFSQLALAHPGHGFDSVLAGFFHPFAGMDHLLVMLAVGIWATRQHHNAPWKLPFIFMLLMAAGMLFGAWGYQINGLETTIAATVIAMGLLLASTLRQPASVTVFMTMLFAVLHGMAHGQELSNQQLLAAMLGMLLGTGCLHLMGVWLGLQQRPLLNWFRQGLACFMIAIGAYWSLMSL